MDALLARVACGTTTVMDVARLQQMQARLKRYEEALIMIAGSLNHADAMIACEVLLGAGNGEEGRGKGTPHPACRPPSPRSLSGAEGRGEGRGEEQPWAA